MLEENKDCSWKGKDDNIEECWKIKLTGEGES
jgi:hypothetical protein